jgi:hypothetical protein
MKKKLDKKYVSPADHFLAEFDATHAPSASQLAEMNKYKDIHEKRDDASLKPQVKTDALWD